MERIKIFFKTIEVAYLRSFLNLNITRGDKIPLRTRRSGIQR